MLDFSTILLIALAFINADALSAERIQFRVNVTDISTVNFIWNPAEDFYGTFYTIYCTPESGGRNTLIYSGRNVNYTTNEFRPFKKYYCDLFPCPASQPFCTDQPTKFTFVNIAPERLQPVKNFVSQKLNESAVLFKWADMITPYFGDYDLTCLKESESKANPIVLQQRVNSTSFEWISPNSTETYKCTVSICWRALFNGTIQENCISETASSLTFKPQNLAYESPRSSVASSLAASYFILLLMFFVSH